MFNPRLRRFSPSTQISSHISKSCILRLIALPLGVSVRVNGVCLCACGRVTPALNPMSAGKRQQQSPAGEIMKGWMENCFVMGRIIHTIGKKNHNCTFSKKLIVSN